MLSNTSAKRKSLCALRDVNGACPSTSSAFDPKRRHILDTRDAQPRECELNSHGQHDDQLASGTTVTASPEIILGILSLIIWALILVVTVKYVLILLRARLT